MNVFLTMLPLFNSHPGWVAIEMLSMWRCSDELRVRAEELRRSSKRDAKHYIEFWKQVPASEPYRVILSDVRDKLYQTRERSRHLLAHDISDIPEEGTFTNIEQKVGDTTRKPLNNTGSTKVSKSFTDGNKFSLGNSVYNLISKGSKTKSRKDTTDSEYKQTLTNKPVAKEMRDSLSLDADAK
ncbi:hypothetical protein HYC85_010863 [Camellia sinensis]|uniref:phosphoenolpyruvate carboxylase n=1 Tax=Camellia sinensis TaxID=4442 RepID=A0A7J7HJL9_CAMSI|nr:hypothetical protein HYC85_010863 [Camellia sinensis]